MRNLSSHWTVLVQTHDHARVEFVGTQLVGFVFFWCLASAFLAIDVFFPTFSAKHKLQARGKQPTRHDIVDCFLVVARNQLLSTGLLATGLYLSGRPGPYSFAPALPRLGELVRDITFCVLLREVLFYYAHRALHHRAVYPRVHKVHHRFAAPIALAAQYAHPVEHLLANVLPIAIPPQLLRAHIVTMWAFVALELVESTFVHSGYDFCAGLARMHDLHHEAFNVNFGTIGLLDRLHGTWSSRQPQEGVVRAFDVARLQ